jgi:hypothetical protein
MSMGDDGVYGGVSRCVGKGESGTSSPLCKGYDAGDRWGNSIVLSGIGDSGMSMSIGDGE